jgi:hypothetical protein
MRTYRSFVSFRRFPLRRRHATEILQEGPDMAIVWSFLRRSCVLVHCCPLARKQIPPRYSRDSPETRLGRSLTRISPALLAHAARVERWAVDLR